MNPALQVLAPHPSRAVDRLEDRREGAGHLVPGNPEDAGFAAVDVGEQARKPHARAAVVAKCQVRLDAMAEGEMSEMVEDVQLRILRRVPGEEHVTVPGPADVADGSLALERRDAGR